MTLAKRDNSPMFLIADVIDIFLAAGSPVKFFVGDAYLSSEDEAANRIVIVPEDAEFDIRAERLSAGEKAAVRDTFAAYIWGAAHEDDLKRFDSAFEMRNDLLVALNMACPGKILGQGIRRNRTTEVVTYGEQLQLRFSYLNVVQAESKFVKIAGGWTAQPTTVLKGT